MKLAISNIAWNSDQEQSAARILERAGITGLEIAPGRVAPAPAEASAAEITRYRDFWNSHGIRIVAMQALLFGAPPFQLFGPEESRQGMRDYLEKIIRLGGQLGAKSLVFGSPKQRQRQQMPLEQAQEIAINFFRHLGHVAQEAGTCLCVEPNPTYYECDFVTQSDQALDLVNQVDHPGFGLHLDAAALRLAGENARSALEKAGSMIRHFHISEPDLAALGADHPNGNPNHQDCAAALKALGYDHWLSIEMRAGQQPLKQVEAALSFAKEAYGASVKVAAA